MEKKNNWNPDIDVASQVKAALQELDREWVEVEGNRLRPSQCYHFDMDPPHVLFNTNCPDNLKQKVQAILSKYTVPDEARSQQ